MEEVVKIVMPGADCPDRRLTATEVGRELARRAARALSDIAFKDTAEGEDFWYSIIARLEQIANGGPLR